MKPFALSDLGEAHALSSKIGWPHRLDDWQFAARLGQGYSVRQDGELVGTCLTWPMGCKVSSLGLLIVDANVGRQGLGRRLLRACMNDLHGRTITLNATEMAEQLYRSESFACVGTIAQVQGVASSINAQTVETDLTVRAIEVNDFSEICALDQMASGVDRQAVLREVLVEGRGVVLIDEGQTIGFALHRHFGRGTVIGPVIGRSQIEARFIIQQLLLSLAGQFVRLDIVMPEMETSWLETFGLKNVDRVSIMANGRLPQSSQGFVKFALIGHAFG